MIKCVKTQEFKKFAQLLIAFITVTDITFCPGAIIASGSFHCPSRLTTRFVLLFFPSINTSTQGSVCETSFLTNTPFLL